MEELDNPANMRAWAFDAAERKRTRVRFVDLVTFVDKEAKMANVPLFGDLHVNTSEGKERQIPVAARMTNKDKPRGRSFATVCYCVVVLKVQAAGSHHVTTTPSPG